MKLDRSKRPFGVRIDDCSEIRSIRHFDRLDTEDRVFFGIETKDGNFFGFSIERNSNVAQLILGKQSISLTLDR